MNTSGFHARSAVTLASLLMAACATQAPEIASTPPSVLPRLVAADGTYDTVPLAKDEIVIKVIQTTVDSLQDFPSVEEGLEHNLQHMTTPTT